MATYVSGLKIYGFTNGFTLVVAPPFLPPLGTFPIAVSYSWRALWQFQPHHTFPQTLLLLVVPLHSNSPVGGSGSMVSVSCARTALAPSAHPPFHLFCLLIHGSLWSSLSRTWKDEHAAKQSFSFLKIMSQGLSLGFLVIYSTFG